MSAGGPVRRQAEVALQIGLTVAAFVCFYGVFRLVQNSIRPPDFTRQSPTGYGPPGTERAVARNIRFPWPSYPGARVMQSYQVVMEKDPLQQQMLEIAAPADQIIDFYRQRLHGKGYRDVTDRSLGLSPEALAQPNARLNPNSEVFARGYDRLRQSSLLMHKGERTVLVRVQPGPKSWIHSVHLMAFSHDAGEQMAARHRGRDIGGGITEIGGGRSPDRFGDETYSTRFYQARMGVNRLYDRLRDRLTADGWEPRQFGDTDRAMTPDGTATGHFTRRNEERLVVVTSGDRGGSSIGCVTTIDASP